MSEQARILIIDDDPAIRSEARGALPPLGLMVDEASTAEEGLAILRREARELVLLDLSLPDGGGLKACRALRALPQCADTAVVMLVDATDLGSIQQAYDAGATDVAVRPIRWPLVAQRLAYMLRSARDRARLTRSQRQLAHAQRLARLGSWEWDTRTGQLFTSEETRRILGIDAGEIIDPLAMLERIHPEDRGIVMDVFRRVAARGRPQSVDHRLLIDGGLERVVHVEVEMLSGEAEEDGVLSGTLQDVTERKLTEERIRRLAYFDPLTGLPNRQHFRERLSRAVVRAAASGGRLALLLLDLDDFKVVNDGLGHSAGDELLREVTHRLVRRLRRGDWGESGAVTTASELARLGGDEFALLISDLRGGDDAALVAARLLDELSRPIDLDGREVVVSASLGIALYPDHGQDVEELARNADAAMYCAKAVGKSSWRFYSSAQSAEVEARLNTEHGIRQALRAQEFVLYYQPQLDLVTGRIVGAESLIRWRHPTRGLVSPGEFIPIAEESGLITRIGAWALTQACQDARSWLDLGIELSVAVNVSARQFLGDALPLDVEAALRETGLPPHLLELELTETAVMADARHAAATLGRLRALGVRVAIDDFGTGHSSLAKLRSLPVDSLKIDRTFVQDVHEDPQSQAIVESIINLGRGLGHVVVAEGVELDEQLAFLTAHGCALAQGYLISEPTTAVALLHLVLAEAERRSA